MSRGTGGNSGYPSGSFNFRTNNNPNSIPSPRPPLTGFASLESLGQAVYNQEFRPVNYHIGQSGQLSSSASQQPGTPYPFQGMPPPPPPRAMQPSVSSGAPGRNTIGRGNQPQHPPNPPPPAHPSYPPHGAASIHLPTRPPPQPSIRASGHSQQGIYRPPPPQKPHQQVHQSYQQVALNTRNQKPLQRQPVESSVSKQNTVLYEADIPWASQPKAEDAIQEQRPVPSRPHGGVRQNLKRAPTLPEQTNNAVRLRELASPVSPLSDSESLHDAKRQRTGNNPARPSQRTGQQTPQQPPPQYPQHQNSQYHPQQQQQPQQHQQLQEQMQHQQQQQAQQQQAQQQQAQQQQAQLSAQNQHNPQVSIGQNQRTQHQNHQNRPQQQRQRQIPQQHGPRPGPPPPAPQDPEANQPAQAEARPTSSTNAQGGNSRPPACFQRDPEHQGGFYAIHYENDVDLHPSHYQPIMNSVVSDCKIIAVRSNKGVVIPLVVKGGRRIASVCNEMHQERMLRFLENGHKLQCDIEWYLCQKIGSHFVYEAKGAYKAVNCPGNTLKELYVCAGYPFDLDGIKQEDIA